MNTSTRNWYYVFGQFFVVGSTVVISSIKYLVYSFFAIEIVTEIPQIAVNTCLHLRFGNILVKKCDGICYGILVPKFVFV